MLDYGIYLPKHRRTYYQDTKDGFCVLNGRPWSGNSLLVVMMDMYVLIHDGSMGSFHVAKSIDRLYVSRYDYGTQRRVNRLATR